MIYEYFRATDAHGAVLDYSDLFFVLLYMATIFRILIQDGTKFYFQSNGSILESVYEVRIRASCQLKTALANVRTGNQSKFIEAEFSEVEDHGKETYRSKDQETKLSGQKRKN